MAKVQKIFVCHACGTTYQKWQGQCSACQEWNTIEEEVLIKESASKEEKKSWRAKSVPQKAKPLKINEVPFSAQQRIQIKDLELNRVLGGGIVPGVIVLLGGEPGIGKSTLLLQMALEFNGKVLYISGEESEEQIKMRADRLGSRAEQCYVMTETSIAHILQQAGQLQPDILIIDSIQTMISPLLDSSPGSVSQVRECASEFQKFAKEVGVPVFLIGHINKDGAIAGPKLLEHIVDVVLQFEGDRNYTHRILRTVKNRFGSTHEIGIYEMFGAGLRQVSNPSELLLSQMGEGLSGSAVAATLEGIRPMQIEVQALVSPAVYSAPQRSSTGFDLRRLGMILAVLEKKCGFQFAANDVFLNIAGGIKIQDPALDLAVVAALISSLEDTPIPSDICFAGEIGLSGEIRSVQRIEQRISEAARLGFKQIFISRFNAKKMQKNDHEINIVPLEKIVDVYDQLFQ